MADSALPSVVEPGDRGTLTVRDKVIERIALAAVRSADGVASGPSGLTRRASSRIKLSQNNSRVTAEVSAQWPRSAADVGTNVRRSVTTALTDAGVAANSVDVAVTSVVGTDSRGSQQTPDLPISREPRLRPAAAPIASIVSLLLVAAGVVGVRDALVAGDVTAGASWTGWLIENVDGTTSAPWMVPVGIAVAVVGVLLVIAAVKPRGRRHRTAASPDVWIRRNAVERLVTAASSAVTGVAPSRVRVSRKSVTVRASGSDSLQSSVVKADVHEAVTRVAAVLDPAPSVMVEVTS